jgi:hypothetical protein
MSPKHRTNQMLLIKFVSACLSVCLTFFNHFSSSGVHFPLSNLFTYLKGRVMTRSLFGWNVYVSFQNSVGCRSLNVLLAFWYCLVAHWFSNFLFFLSGINTLIFAIVERRVCANLNSFAVVICFCVLSSSCGFEDRKYSHLFTILHPEPFVSYIIAMVAILNWKQTRRNYCYPFQHCTQMGYLTFLQWHLFLS